MLKPGEGSDALYHLRGGGISMIFQEPMTALSPVHTIGNQIREAILLRQDVSKSEARAKASAMLTKVGIPGADQRIHQYPFEMSGGMRQRVVIASQKAINTDRLSQCELVGLRFRRHKLAVVALYALGCMYLIAAFTGTVAPYPRDLKNLDRIYCPPRFRM